jgi:hypothetical protein
MKTQQPKVLIYPANEKLQGHHLKEIGKNFGIINFFTCQNLFILVLRILFHKYILKQNIYSVRRKTVGKKNGRKNYLVVKFLSLTEVIHFFDYYLDQRQLQKMYLNDHINDHIIVRSNVCAQKAAKVCNYKSISYAKNFAGKNFKEIEHKKFDSLIYISQATPNFLSNHYWDDQSHKALINHNFLINGLCQASENGIDVYVKLRPHERISNRTNEYEYYNGRNKNFKLLEDDLAFSNLLKSNKSQLIVTCHSTLGLDLCFDGKNCLFIDHAGQTGIKLEEFGCLVLKFSSKQELVKVLTSYIRDE